jgi:hypothetical protein
VRALAALICVAVSVAGGANAFSLESTASARRVVCPRLQPYVELAFGMWGGAGTSLRREYFAVVGSWGAKKPGAYVIFGSASANRAQTDAACARTSISPGASQTTLSKPFVYRRAGANAYFRAAKGEQLIGELLHRGSLSELHLREPNGVSFECPTTSRVIVETRAMTGGNELRVSHGTALLAVASVRSDGASSFRISNRCQRD